MDPFEEGALPLGPLSRWERLLDLYTKGTEGREPNEYIPLATKSAFTSSLFHSTESRPLIGRQTPVSPIPFTSTGWDHLPICIPIGNGLRRLIWPGIRIILVLPGERGQIEDSEPLGPDIGPRVVVAAGAGAANDDHLPVVHDTRVRAARLRRRVGPEPDEARERQHVQVRLDHVVVAEVVPAVHVSVRGEESAGFSGLVARPRWGGD